MQSSDQDKKRADVPDVRWRVTTATGAQFACRVYIIGARIEVRLTTEQGSLVCARAAPSLEAADALVRRWLSVVVAKDGVGELLSGLLVEVVH